MEAEIRVLEGEKYLSGVSVDGHFIHERTDALRWDAERDIVEARYGYAIRCLKKAGANTVLDMACGLGYGTWMLDRAGFTVEGVELSEDALEVARARYPWLKFHQGDILKFEHAAVDGIVATEILEHIEDARGFLKRMSEMLNPGGVLIITTPNGKYTKLGANIYHEHEYTPDEMRGLFPGIRIGAISTKLFKPARVWEKILGVEGYARMNYKLARRFPFHGLYRFARTFAVCARKEELESMNYEV
jgi:SAM-dependent methyltransferase